MSPTAEKIAYHPLIRHCVHGLRLRCGVHEGDRILVATSGGADSVALLRALHLLSRRRRWRLSLHVGHIQHHLRDTAETDAGFVADLARTLDLPYHRRDIAIPPGNTEAHARRLRYTALADIAADTGARHLATAHHADDQLETVLMRLLRGTTARGLRGIAWRRPLPDRTAAHRLNLIRPMLAATHAQAVDFLRQLPQPWREDPTNADLTRTRARLRHQVLPILRDLRPSVARKVLEMTDSLRRDPPPDPDHQAT